MSEQHTKSLAIELTKAASDAFDASFILSASTPDRVNDEILPKAYDDVARTTGKLIALWQHKSDAVCGYWSNLRREGDTLIADFKAASTNLGKMVKALIDDGVPLGASVGFTGSGKQNKNGGFTFDAIKLLETSIVSVGCHPRAVQIAKSYGLEEFVGVTSNDHGNQGASAHSTTPPNLPALKEKPMSIAEKIVAREKELVELRDRATMIVKSMDADDADIDSLNDELAVVNQNMEKAQSLIDNLKETESKLAVKAEPVQRVSASVATNLGSYKEPKTPMDLFAKMAVATVVADRDRISVAQAIEDTYGDAEYLKSAYSIVRNKSVAGNPPLNTFTTGAAQELVREATVQFVETLKVESLAAKLGARSRQISFDGRPSVKITRRNPTATSGLTEPAWVHESRPIPIQGFGVGQQTIDRGKLASIIPFTLELLESNNVVALESELRDAMVEAAAVRLDQTFFSNAAGIVRVHSAGILNGVTPTTATAGGGITAISTDIENLYNAMITARVGARPILLMNSADRIKATFTRTSLGDLAFRDELASGTLMGIPVIDGPTLPKGTVIMVDSAYLAFGLDTPMFDMSRDATLVALNADGTKPSHAGLAADGDTTGKTAGNVGLTEGVPVSNATAAAAPAYNLFQHYEAAIRMVQFGGWGVTVPGSVQTTNSISW